MPRDLTEYAKQSTLNKLPELTKSPAEMEDEGRSDLLDTGSDHDSDKTEYESDDGPLGAALAQRNDKRDELHPYTQTLTVSDIESCVKLEEATFPPQERCTREKFQYRLKECGELSLGIFTSSESKDAVTTEASKPVYSGAPQRKAVLLGHIVSTKSEHDRVTDDAMSIPESGDSTSKLGHKEFGQTVCIHSLAVLPEYQNKGLGKTLLKSFLQRLEAQGVAERAALIAHDHMIEFYEKLGFVNKGESACKFGGGGWYDMVYEIDPEEA